MRVLFSRRRKAVTGGVSLPSLAIAGPAVTPEGTGGTTAFAFPVTRGGASAVAVRCDWSVAGSGTSPANAADFAGGVLPSGTLSFAAGDTVKTISVSVAGDTLAEANEGFAVTLANPIGALIGTASATATIIDDDVAAAFTPATIASLKRAWTPASGVTASGGTASAVAGAWGTSSALTLTGGPALLVGLGPQAPGATASDLLGFASASSQFGSFALLDMATTPSDMELWVTVAVRSTSAATTIVGRSGTAGSAITIANGGAGLNVRTNSGANVVAPLPFALNAGFHRLRLVYAQAAGTVTPYLDGVAGTATSVGTQGFAFDQLGRQNAGTYANQFMGPLLIFGAQLSAADAASMDAFLAPWTSTTYYASSSAGSDASATPWNQATPFASVAPASSFGLRSGDTFALKMGEVFRSQPFAFGSAGTVLDGGLWGSGAYAELRGSVAPTLTAVSGTVYSFPLTAAPKCYVFALANGRATASATITRLVQDTASPTAPAVGKWGWSGGTCTVNTGAALTNGDIETSYATTADFLSTTGAGSIVRRVQLRMAQSNGLSNSATGFMLDRVTAECNQGDGLDNFGSATFLFQDCVATRNGAGTTQGSDGDGYSCHGTSAGTFLRCRSIDNDRTCFRHLVTTTTSHQRCLAVGSWPFQSTPATGTPVGSFDVVNCIGVVQNRGSADGLFAVYNNNVGPMKVWGCSFWTQASEATSYAIYADTAGGSIDVRDTATRGFTNSLVQGSGTTIAEDYNILGSNRLNAPAGAHSLVADPLFNDPANLDFAPKAGSPCRGAGAAIAALAIDYAGVTRATTPSIGAIEPA